MFLSLKLVVVILFLGIASCTRVFSQFSDHEGAGYHELLEYIMEKHGMNPEIINGKAYYNKYYRVLNHPYFSAKNSHQGWLVFSGKRYRDVRINYNIYEQNLVLEYRGWNDGIYKIVLSPVHTEAFTLDDLYFEKKSLLDNEPAFYQVIEIDGITCYIHWKKQILATTNNTEYSDFFSEPSREYYLDHDNKLSPFNNKRTFTLKFPDIPKSEIRKYMRHNKISFRDASTDQIKSLLKFVSSRINQSQRR